MAIAETLIRSCVLVVAAHPDDETIGAGGLLGHLHDPYILHVTDGAPRNLEFARAAGFQTRAQYARARQEELASALRLAGISASRWLSLGITDQTASLDLAGLVHRLLRLLRTIVPQAVLSHAYEGGHPDHDATAFAIHAACRLLPSPPRIYEFTSYHAARPPLAMESGRFLVGQETGEITALDESDQRRKSAMLACFRSQRAILRHFRCAEERFREAPTYDFAQPPHSGQLFYETFPSNMSGACWLRLAAEALRQLEVPALL